MIVIYSAPGCTVCDQAAALLESKGIKYEKTDIYEDNDAMNNMRDLGLRSVPQVFLQDGDTLVHIGDFKKLKSLTDAQLQQLK